jgi:glycosyltransferase involved in cell wall biosynthesis
MKILWVKSGGLVPLDHGGKIRSFQLARILAQFHDVSLFTFYPPTPNDEHTELKQIFSQVMCASIGIPERNGVSEYVAYARNLFSRRPYSMTKYCQPHVARQLRQHLQKESYDVIVCDFLVTAGIIPWDLPGPRVLFTHNVEAQIWERHYQVAQNPIWKAACYREFKTMTRMERHYLRRAEHVLAVSEADRRLFTRCISPSKISVIPTGVDVDYFRPTLDLEQPNSLVFTGSMDWLPNEDGVLYFADKILPLIRQDLPDIVLWVVGRRPSARLKSLAKQDLAVKVTGRVEDIRPHMARGSVYVVPLLVGGGTRLKIFEAMAMSKAIVSTSVGAEGLPVTSGKDIILSDEAGDFARQVIGLLRDPVKRREVGRSARQLVEGNYSWSSVGEQLSSVLQEVAHKFSTDPNYGRD